MEKKNTSEPGQIGSRYGEIALPHVVIIGFIAASLDAASFSGGRFWPKGDDRRQIERAAAFDKSSPSRYRGNIS